MANRIGHYAAILVGVGVFSAAVYVLSNRLAGIEWAHVADGLGNVSLTSILASLGFTFAAYLILTVYDTTAFTYIGRPLHYLKVAYVSFIAYAFSHSLGVGAVTGGSVRYRFYTAWGIAPFDIAAVILFGGTAYVLGIVAVAGGLLLLNAEELVAVIDVPLWVVLLAGKIAMVAGCAFLIWSLVGWPVIRARGQVFPPPRFRICLAQLVVAFLEWCFASAALYFLLPAGTEVSYWHFVGIYVIAYVAGMVSQVPGGVGVFDVIILELLGATEETRGGLVAAILIYRLFYFILPLLLGAGMMAASEVVFQRRRVLRFRRPKNRDDVPPPDGGEDVRTRTGDR